MAKYIYPAIFTEEKDGYSVYFPDVDGCFTGGNTLLEAVEMAQDALALMLVSIEVDGKLIPPVTPIQQIQTGENSFATLIFCDTTNYVYRDCEAVIHLKNAREKAGLTIQQLAEISNIPVDVLEEIELKEYGTVTNAIKIAEALKIEFHEFCEEQEDDEI